MSEARELLAQLRQLQMELSILEQEKERALPEDCRKILEDIETEYAPKFLAVEDKIKELEKEVKEAVIAEGHTINSLTMMAVYIPPKPKWDNAKLEGYAASHPEILTLRTMGNPSVTIRKRNGNVTMGVGETEE